MNRFLLTLMAYAGLCLAPPAFTAEVRGAPPEAAAEQAVAPYVFPRSVRLQYDIRGESKGFPYSANAELQWLKNGNTYEARMEITHFLLGSKVQTSSGQLTPSGLEPARFGSRFRGEEVAHFERGTNKVTFSANTPDAPLRAGAQDQLSIYLQMASRMAGAPGNFPTGSTLTFQTIGVRTSESWIFTVGPSEKLNLPGGEVNAIRLWRDPANDGEAKGEIWLAPAMDYLPVRIRATQGNHEFVDQQWRATQRP